MSKTSITLIEGNSTTLTATVIPSDASDKSIKWYSNNTSVAIVNNGEVTAIAEGNAIITVESNDGGYTATCNVTVTGQNSGDDSGGADPDPDDHTKISIKVNLQEFYDWSDDEWEEQLNKSYKSNDFVGFGANFKEIKYENEWISICFDGDVTSIPSNAYATLPYATTATKIVLPNSVISIGDLAFVGTGYCNSINFPESLVDIGEHAFYNSGITDLILPETVISIGEYAFWGCTNLNSVSIPTSLDIIPNYCFGECIGLSEVTIPSSVKKIGESAFEGCNGLKMLTIGDNSTVATMEIDEDAFVDCISLTNAKIGSEVKIIEYGAFKGCNNLSKISFGDNISSGTMKIGARVFQNCSSLKEVIFGTELSEIGEYSFESCTSLESFTIPETVINIGRYAFKNCTSVKSVVIPGGVSHVEESAFENCTSLQTLTIGDDDTSHGTSISSNAFKNCSSLEKTTLNKSVILNPTNVFKSATGDIVINCNLDNCSDVFAYSQFDSVTIGSDINRIGKGTFANMKFDIINIGENVLEIGEDAFMSAEGNKVVFTSNSKLNRIKGGGFAGCKIIDLDLPESLVIIENSAFSSASINNLTVGANVKGIGYTAFFRTSGDITIKCDLSNISDDMYSEDVIHDECFIGNYFTSIRIIGNYETLPHSFISGNGADGVEIMDKFIIEGTIKKILAAGINPKRLNELHLCKSIQSIYGLFNNLLMTTEVLNVYCAPPTPPTIYDDLPFSDNTKIYVPRNSVDDYKTDENWSKFADNIIGYDFK